MALPILNLLHIFLKTLLTDWPLSFVEKLFCGTSIVGALLVAAAEIFIMFMA